MKEFCRYVITPKNIKGGPQYTIQTRRWKTGDEATSTDFSFKNPTNAEKVELENLLWVACLDTQAARRFNWGISGPLKAAIDQPRQPVEI